MDDNEIFDFPCIFPVKAVGRNLDGFEAWVVEIVKRHAPQSAINIDRKLSGGEQYLSLTVTFVAESRAQLDGIYKDFGEDPDVLMAL